MVLLCGDANSKALCTAEGHQIHGADVQDAHAHAKASGIKTHNETNSEHIEWACKVPGKEIKKGLVMEVAHSLQGHALSGKQWMKMIDKILIDNPSFTATTHGRLICKRTDLEETISIPQQVEDAGVALGHR